MLTLYVCHVGAHMNCAIFVVGVGTFTNRNDMKTFILLFGLVCTFDCVMDNTCQTRLFKILLRTFLIDAKIGNVKHMTKIDMLETIDQNEQLIHKKQIIK